MKDNMPEHVAIIMDGNSRWALKNQKNILSAYQQGIKVAGEIIIHAKDLGIKYLTLFVFSTENWNRPKNNIKIIMNLLRYYLINDIKALINQKISINFIGNLARLDPDIQNCMNKIRLDSKEHPFKLRLAISYGGRDEIIRSLITFLKKYPNPKFLDDLKQVENKFSFIINPDKIPDPELLIRTSGEYRLSNFLLWQLAYTELIFIKKFWPDFNIEDFNYAMNKFSVRNRRFGT